MLRLSKRQTTRDITNTAESAGAFGLWEQQPMTCRLIQFLQSGT